MARRQFRVFLSGFTLVAALGPAVALSAFQSAAERRIAKAEFTRTKLTAEAVADAAIRAMARKQLYVILPVKARVIWWIKRLSPRLFFRVIALEVNRRLNAR